MRNVTILWLYIKRMLKRPSMWLLLMGMPITVIGINGLAGTKTADILIGIVVEDNGLRDIQDGLINKEGMLSFVGYENRSDLIADVENKTLECGYVLTDKLQRGDDLRKSILCIESPSTVLSAIADEMVFGQVLKCRSDDMAYEFLIQNGVEADKEQISQRFNKYITAGETFALEYEDMGTEDTAGEYKESVFTLGIRGIMSVFMLIAVLPGVIIWQLDERRAIKNKGICNIAAILILTGVSTIVTVGVTRGLGNIIIELGMLIIYGVACLGFGWCIKEIVSDSNAVCGLIPVLAIGSLVFCPVFWDIGSVLPVAGIVQKIFLPSYYLNSVQNVSQIKWLCVVAVGLNVIGCILSKLKNKSILQFR